MKSRIRRGGGRVYGLRAELRGVAPTIWRRLDLSGHASLRELATVIECAFIAGIGGYRFLLDGVHYLDAGDEPPSGRCADDVSLDALALHVGARLVLTVDGLSDPWEYVLTVEEVAPRLVGQRLPVCGAGAGGLPEFADGPSVVTRLLDSWRDPVSAALEGAMPPPPGFDPDYVDLVAINAALGRVPRHRPAP